MFTIFKKKIFSHENTLIVQGFSHFWVDTSRKLNCKMNRNCKIQIQNELFMVVNICIHIDFIPLKFDI